MRLVLAADEENSHAPDVLRRLTVCRRRDEERQNRDNDSQGMSITIVHFHQITLSALAKMLAGTVIPICLAVFKLMISSNFVGCSMGRSPGMAPLRILST